MDSDTKYEELKSHIVNCKLPNYDSCLFDKSIRVVNCFCEYIRSLLDCALQD